MDVFAVQSLSRLTITQNIDRSLEFNPSPQETTSLHGLARLLMFPSSLLIEQTQR